ncbi:MAG: hypothetical protein M3O35_02115 [Acidobacteriota bacterium]|nr:hypothetical protein [Acidobacteriota bacterium]
MYSTSPVSIIRVTAIYSARRHRYIPVRIHYSVREHSGCRVFSLHRVDELE